MEERIQHIIECITTLQTGKNPELLQLSNEELIQWRLSPDILDDCFFLLQNYPKNDAILFHTISALIFIIEKRWKEFNPSIFEKIIPILLNYEAIVFLIHSS